jgi:hypothetical protein
VPISRPKTTKPITTTTNQITFQSNNQTKTNQALGLANFCDVSDALVLEDDAARLALRDGGSGALDVGRLVTGARARMRGGRVCCMFACLLVSCTFNNPSQPLKKHHKTTHQKGVVAAVRGRAEAGGDFVVSDICFAGAPPQPPRPPPLDKDVYVAFVSGLELSGPRFDRLRVRCARGWRLLCRLVFLGCVCVFCSLLFVMMAGLFVAAV